MLGANDLMFFGENLQLFDNHQLFQNNFKIIFQLIYLINLSQDLFKCKYIIKFNIFKDFL